MRKIPLLLLIIFLIISKIIIAQGSDVFDAPYKYISPELERYDGNKKNNFSAIKIIDARPDTSKIGLFRRGVNLHNEPDIRRLNYTNGLTEDVTLFLSNYYGVSFAQEGDSILLVIKKAWVSQYDTTLAIGNNLIGSGRIFLTKLKLEIYLKHQQDFYPVARIDTSYITTNKRSVNNFEYEITDAIIHCVDTLFPLNTRSVLLRKRYNLQQINQFNSRNFDYPILKTNKYKKGIYVTFSEFLNNEPSLNYVSVDKTKYGDVLYLNDGKGGEMASNKFWGYSDGKDLYIVSGKNFFKLVRVQNTFEFYGIKNLRERFYYNDNVPWKRKPAMDMFIYQVDMETGETY